MRGCAKKPKKRKGGRGCAIAKKPRKILRAIKPIGKVFRIFAR